MDINLNEYERIYSKEKFSFNGLSSSQINNFRNKYGANSVEKRVKISFIKRIFRALCEPMILILIFACIITLGINIGNLLAGKEGDFYECIGIIGAILLSTGLTVIMESKSEKAFETLQKLSNVLAVSVIRDGEKKVIDQTEVVVGDILLAEAGDKIVADGVIIECREVETEESYLTGESLPQKKNAFVSGKFKQENMLYSGSYLKSGIIKMLVLSVGKNAQIGKIAENLSTENSSSAPLSQKLNVLSKKISIFGGIAALITFLLTLFRLYTTNSFNFENLKDAFIQAVVLIVAAVPEGLPTTVAIALALSVVRLAKSNAVIKKLVAAETVGCVSVICSDKTGTLTVGKMQVSKFIDKFEECKPKDLKNNYIIDNITYNSTAYFTFEKGNWISYGNSTEQALLSAVYCNKYKDLSEKRAKIILNERENFSSKRKYMLSCVSVNGEKITYIKGSIEKVIEKCSLNEELSKEILKKAERYAKQAERVIAFAHKLGNDNFIFDGFCSITDEIRADVFNSVSQCQKAGIKVKILTGDSVETAVAIAKKLSLPHDFSNVLSGGEVNNLSDEELKEKLKTITVVARSTPETKLRIVKLLKEMGEIVAVTGDGVNDAPAVKNADIGIAMGNGSEITKEASDIILMDNSFSVILKAVAFGRNIYRNFQRFLFFQLTVNFSAVGIIIAFLLLGFPAPFTALQLLWINIIMDGPLALSLGLEKREGDYMVDPPVKRTDSIVTKKMFLRTAIHAIIIVVAIVMQRLYNYLNVNLEQMSGAIFSLFVLFQLFNAVNAREIGHKSILNTIGSNKLFSLLFTLTLVMQVLITEFAIKAFSPCALGFKIWIKVILVTFSIVLLSEFYKAVYRYIRNMKFFKK